MENVQTPQPEQVVIPSDIWEDIVDILYEPTESIIREATSGRIIRAVAQKTNKNGTAGRPPLNETQKMDMLRQAFLMGCTDEEACLFADCSTSWFYEYQKENPEFMEKKELWKKNPVLQARRNIFEAIAIFGDTQISGWYLSRKAKDEFSLRSEITGPDGKAIEMELDKLDDKKTDYGNLATKAAAAIASTTVGTSGAVEGQVVETDTPVQNQE